MFMLRINGKQVSVDVAKGTPLLGVLRDTLGLTGTKFGCGIAACGACAVNVGGAVTRFCVTPVKQVVVARRSSLSRGCLPIITILFRRPGSPEQVPQCGYCQSGMIMAAAALLKDNPKPSDDDIDSAISNI